MKGRDSGWGLLAVWAAAVLSLAGCTGGAGAVRDASGTFDDQYVATVDANSADVDPVYSLPSLVDPPLQAIFLTEWGEENQRGPAFETAGCTMGSAFFCGPRAIVRHKNGSLYVIEVMNRAKRLAPDGTVLTTWGWDSKLESPDGMCGVVGSPRDLAIAPDGSILIVEAQGNCVARYDEDGSLLNSWTVPTSEGEFCHLSEDIHPSHIAVTPDGDVLVHSDQATICTNKDWILHYDVEGKLSLKEPGFASDTLAGVENIGFAVSHLDVDDDGYVFVLLRLICLPPENFRCPQYWLQIYTPSLTLVRELNLMKMFSEATAGGPPLSEPSIAVEGGMDRGGLVVVHLGAWTPEILLFPLDFSWGGVILGREECPSFLAQQPQTPGTICGPGVAAVSHDRLYIPDMQRNVILVFALEPTVR